jgi:hypothetical protein
MMSQIKVGSRVRLKAFGMFPVTGIVTKIFDTRATMPIVPFALIEGRKLEGYELDPRCEQIKDLELVPEYTGASNA